MENGKSLPDDCRRQLQINGAVLSPAQLKPGNNLLALEILNLIRDTLKAC